MTGEGFVFNPPPGWPTPPPGWQPPKGWKPDPSWPEPPPGWQLWVPVETSSGAATTTTTVPDTRLALLEAENAWLRNQLQSMESDGDVVLLDDERILQEVGIYRYHHPLENAPAYKDRLKRIGGDIANLVKAGAAIEKSNTFTFDNSLAKGRKMTKDLAKLMLRAYNAEADNCLRSLRAGNVISAKKRIEKSRAAIAKLGKMMEMHISDAYHELRLEEFELTADYLMKKQEEREEAREQRARLREERRVAAELAEERSRLDKERDHITKTLEALRKTGSIDTDLERRLAMIDDAIEQNDFRAANIRAGHVYIISNRGAFGDNIVKIGLTRRLEPEDRVSELGGASVPFRFDLHALFFSEDAVTLESELHAHFHDRRVNHANSRKEFFFARPSEVRDVLESKVGHLLEFTERAESTEYLQSIRHWPANIRLNTGESAD